jgi:hypothetical protein
VEKKKSASEPAWAGATEELFPYLANTGRTHMQLTDSCKYEDISGHYQSSYFYPKHSPVYIPKHNVSGTGFCLRLQIKQINRASPYLQNLVFLNISSTVLD